MEFKKIVDDRDILKRDILKDIEEKFKDSYKTNGKIIRDSNGDSNNLQDN